MNESTLGTVLQRLAHLESEARWWKRLGCAAVATLGLVMFLGASGARVPDEIQARRFVLVDRNGRSRAELGMEEDGRVTLSLSDNNAHVRVALTVGPDGEHAAGLGFYDENGQRLNRPHASHDDPFTTPHHLWTTEGE